MPGIDDCLSAATKDGRVPGVIASVGSAERVIYEGAFGERSLGGGVPMTMDTVFFIASMTKAITGTAAMQQVERGRLSLDAPAGEVCPYLGEVQVLDGFTDSGEPRLRPPKRPVTLRNLLTHSSGFGYEIWNGDYVAYLERTGTPSIFSCANKGLEMPLLFDPGDRWEYGIGIDWVGKMVEAVTGKDLDAVMRTEIFEPLGMDSTGFRLTPSQRERLAEVHLRGPDGLDRLGFETPQEPEFWMGGGGLYSTVADYLRFTRMILRGGELDGHRVLAANTVAEIAQPPRRRRRGTARVGPPVLQRRRLLPRDGREVGSHLPHQHGGHPGRSLGRLPGVGRSGQQLLLDRSGQERERRHGHSGVPVPRRRGLRPLPGVRVGGVCLALKQRRCHDERTMARTRSRCSFARWAPGALAAVRPPGEHAARPPRRHPAPRPRASPAGRTHPPPPGARWRTTGS
jgi:methyl acetate hydrolase